MRKTKKIQKEVEVIEDYICNKCGKSTKEQSCGNYECANLTAYWGYGSKRDGQEHEAHLCEKCYDEFIKSFVIQPDIDDDNYY